MNPRVQETNKPQSFDRLEVKNSRPKSRENSTDLVVTESEGPKKTFRESASSHVNRFVEVMSKPLTATGPATSKKILAALSKDTDPAASLDFIRGLLVGPTRELHDAMFEEMVTILEESDREVQHAFHSLEARWSSMAVVTDNLIAESQTIREHTEKLSNFLKEELEKAERLQRVRLSEMFMVIDAKLEKTTGRVTQHIDELATKIRAEMSEMVANFDRKIENVAQSATASNEKFVANLKSSLDRL